MVCTVCGHCQQCVGVASSVWAWSGVSVCGFMSWSVIECLGVAGSGVEYLGVAGSGVYSVWALPAVCGHSQQCVGVASSVWAWSGVSVCGFMSWSVIECLGVAGSDVEYLGVAGSGVYSVWA